ncbi:MAG TPA: hypothetical protein VMQ54_05795 [Steroidobacteraceae bacterium]|jgi:hypothetical protein|nr:hypothetical protein [Steroidobacteraceae bacterium]
MISRSGTAGILGHYSMFVVMFCIAAGGATSRTASAQDTAPVIDSVTLRQEMRQYEVIYPEFHFHDPSGTVRYIHREVIATSSPKPLTIKDAVISISAEQQIKGATFVGGWPCGPETYYVTLQAFMMNLGGLKSNVVEYTIHCNGG